MKFQLSDRVLHYGDAFVIIGLSNKYAELQLLSNDGRTRDVALRVPLWELEQHQIPWQKQKRGEFAGIWTWVPEAA